MVDLETKTLNPVLLLIGVELATNKIQKTIHAAIKLFY